MEATPKVGSPFGAATLAFDVSDQWSGVDLAGTPDPSVRRALHFDPVSDPAWQSPHGKQDGEHLNRDSHGSVDDTGIEIDVGVKFSFDEVGVAQGDGFELLGYFEERVAQIEFL